MIEIVGKILFPRLPSWRRRTHVMMLVWAIVAGMVTGGAIIGLAFLLPAH